MMALISIVRTAGRRCQSSRACHQLTQSVVLRSLQALDRILSRACTRALIRGSHLILAYLPQDRGLRASHGASSALLSKDSQSSLVATSRCLLSRAAVCLITTSLGSRTCRLTSLATHQEGETQGVTGPLPQKEEVVIKEVAIQNS